MSSCELLYVSSVNSVWFKLGERLKGLPLFFCLKCESFDQVQTEDEKQMNRLLCGFYSKNLFIV
jgi:hypothetical protein